MHSFLRHSIAVGAAVILLDMIPAIPGLDSAVHAQESAAGARGPIHHSATIEGIPFTLADGLQVDKVAGEPLIKWPIVADWDGEGRLVVAESGGIGRPIEEHNQLGLHKIVRLVDENQDGTFDRRIVAAEDLGFPEGVLCLENDILVSAPPVIWKLTDADGDGVCEERQIWFDGKTVTGCANDLHGPYLGRDGWIYWCKGAFGEQTHELADGRTFRSSAAHIHRRRDGNSRIEPVITGGMDNPVEMAFTPEGEKFFTSTFLQHPGGGLRDGIAHAVYGGLFGKDHRVIDGHIRTGPLMPIMTQLGPAAPSGLICLETDRLVDPNNQQPHARFLCAASFNLHKVTAHRLVPNGATFHTEDVDLLATERVDFHPTDVIEDADGSLLVLDTGGWYDLCCPTSRIDQTTAAGGIYRLSRADIGTPTPPTSSARLNPLPDWTSMEADEVISLLVDPRPWIRRRAARVAGQMGTEAVASLQNKLQDPSVSLEERLRFLWALCQMGSSEALASAAQQLHSDHASMVQAACHVVAIHRHQGSISDLWPLLQHPSRQVRRASAEAVGRIGGEASIEPLLQALDHSEYDRHLDHSLIHALIEIARRNPSVQLTPLASSDHRLQAVMLVLDQLGRGNELDPSELFRASTSEDPQLRQVAIEVLASHPAWAERSKSQLQSFWSTVGTNTNADRALSDILAGWKEEAAVREWVGAWLRDASSAKAEQRRFLAENLHRLSPRQLWPDWSAAVSSLLEMSGTDLQSTLAGSLSQLDLADESHSQLVDQVVRLASETDALELRLQLLGSVPLQNRIAGSSMEREVIAAFVDSQGGVMPLAAQVLLRCRLSQAQAEQLVSQLPQVVPQQLMTAIEAIHRSRHAEVETSMFDGLRSLPAARTLPRGFLTNLYKQADKPLRELAITTTDVLESPPADIKRAVDEKLSQLGEGDPVRGLQVFRGERAACSGCHRMGYIGKEIGPDLTRIGGSRTAEALLEAILFPSARLEQSYQSTRVLTVDGQIFNGLIRSQDQNSIELQLTAQRKETLARSEIEQMEPSDVSVMPQGINELLSDQELADLLALLKSAQ